VPEARTRSDRRRRVEQVASTQDATQAVCTVAFCPICMAVTASQGAAPDALEHLLNAAREFFLAARAVIDARADDLERSSGKKGRPLEKIDIA
jgi:hypothetical protein